MFSRWTFFQLIVMIFLVVWNIVADQFKYDVVSPPLQGLGTLIFITIVIGCFYALMLLQYKKNQALFSFSIWERMPFITGVTFATSSVGVIIVLLVFQDWFMNERWGLYIFIHYFLFLLFIFILSLINKYVKTNLIEMKLHASFIVTVVVIIIITLDLPIL